MAANVMIVFCFTISRLVSNAPGTMPNPLNTKPMQTKRVSGIKQG